MARVFLGRRSRGLYFLPWVMGECGESERQGLEATVAAKEALEAGTKLLEGTGKMMEVLEGGSFLLKEGVWRLMCRPESEEM